MILWTYTEVVAEYGSLEDCVGFDWDEANAHKNWERHRVTPEEAEDVFFHEPLVIRSDPRHSKREKRYYALGHTAIGRRLFVVFTIRRKLIRVISVRDMNRNESNVYESYEEESPEFTSEEEERRFWATADSTDFVDWSAAKRKNLLD